jgi:hypothetical protein
MQPKDLIIKKRCRICKKEVTLVFLKSQLLKEWAHPEDLDTHESMFKVLYKIPNHNKSFLRKCEASNRVLRRRMVITYDAQAWAYSYRFIKQRKAKRRKILR